MIHSKKRDKKPYIIIMLFVFAFFLVLNLAVIIPSLLSQNQPYTTTTNAIENECGYCLNEPPCCAQIINQLQSNGGNVTNLPDGQQPYHACDWPIRGYCRPSTCNQLPAGHKYRGNCGWYYMFHDANGNNYHLGTNAENGYGCMVGLTEATMQPRCTAGGGVVTLSQLVATPTTAPTPQSTPAPIPQPTTIPATPVVQPTIEPNNAGYSNTKETILVPPNESAQPTINPFPLLTPVAVSRGFRFPSIQFPSIFLPKGFIDLVALNTAARKPLSLFEDIFFTVVKYDKILEHAINTRLQQLATIKL